MRVLYMGTPDFAVPSLCALSDGGYEIVGVVSQPDRPRGRGRHAETPPVAAVARARGIPVYQPAKVNDPEFVARVREMAPDVIVVAAFGQILRPALLDIPRLGCVNVHGSLLPRHRGGSPVQHTLLDGDPVTGITIMLMDLGMDTGPILLQQEVPVEPDDTAGTLLDKLAHVGADLLLVALPALDAGRLEPIPQDPALATYSPNLKREDARIDWGHTAEAIRNRVRAFSPRPGAWAMLGEREVKVWRAAVADRPAGAEPGTVLDVGPQGVLVATGEGALWLQEVQEAGKSRLAGDVFARGVRLAPGDRFA